MNLVILDFRNSKEENKREKVMECIRKHCGELALEHALFGENRNVYEVLLMGKELPEFEWEYGRKRVTPIQAGMEKTLLSYFVKSASIFVCQ